MQEPEDDLLSPSLVRTRYDVLPEGRRPWRLGSQFYVSVLGGPVAAGLVGYLNGRRLGLPAARLAAIAAVGLAALVAVAIAAAAVSSNADAPLRGISMIGGAVGYLAIRELQKDADRRHGAGRGDDESYDSLWRPGILIVVGGGLAAAVVIAAVTA